MLTILQKIATDILVVCGLVLIATYLQLMALGNDTRSVRLAIIGWYAFSATAIGFMVWRF